MFKQKGLGRARMGDRQSPIRVGGGIIFGPTPRSYRQKTPRKVKRLALLSALRDKLQNGGVMLIDSFPQDEETPKTKRVVSFLNGVGVQRQKTLLVTAESDSWLVLSSRNVPYLEVGLSRQLHPYQILTRDLLIFSLDAWKALLSHLGVEEPLVVQPPAEEVVAEEAPAEEVVAEEAPAEEVVAEEAEAAEESEADEEESEAS